MNVCLQVKRSKSAAKKHSEGVACVTTGLADDLKSFEELHALIRCSKNIEIQGIDNFRGRAHPARNIYVHASRNLPEAQSVQCLVFSLPRDRDGRYLRALSNSLRQKVH